MKYFLIPHICVLICALLSLPLFPDAHAGGNERSIALKDIPKVALTAAKDAVPNFLLQEAELNRKHKYVEYELEGKSAGEDIEIEVRLNKKGDVIKVKVHRHDQDDDDDDHDDD